MKFRLQQRDRTALIVLGTAVALWAVAGQILLPAYDALASSFSDAGDQEEILRKYRQVLARSGSQEQTIGAMAKDLAQMENSVISSATVSLASVELQSIVEKAASSVNISLAQRNVAGQLKPKDAFFGEIAMTLNFEATPGQLVQFLAALRSSPKMLNVRSLQVSPAQPAYEPPKRGELAKTVRANLTVTALVAAAEGRNRK